MKIDVKDIGVDMLSASAHKFNGPKGIGFLYIRKGVELTPFLDGGAQERSLRAGTENIAAMFEILLQGLIESGVEYIRNGGSNTLQGLISISFPNKDGEAILHRLDLQGIIISTGAACDSVNTQISHVLQSIELQEYVSRGTIRISLGKDNTTTDVQAIVAELTKMILT